jgi:hypothetical protein
MSILSGLVKLCTGPASAQPVQPAPVAPAQSAPAQSPTVQPAPKGPCAEIRAACTQAGFVPNGANMGVGIIVDCIRPIIAGTPQRGRATKPLPQIDPQVVVACKNKNPNFGMGGAAKAQPSGQRDAFANPLKLASARAVRRTRPRQVLRKEPSWPLWG